MVKKVLFLILNMLILASINELYSQNQNVEGVWTIYKTTIEKNIGGEITTTTYDRIDDSIKSFVQCPSKLIITSDDIIFEYPNGIQELGTYLIEDDKIKLSTDVGLREYQYELLDSGKILINYIALYLIDGLINVEESYIFYGEKQD